MLSRRYSFINQKIKASIAAATLLGAVGLPAGAGILNWHKSDSSTNASATNAGTPATGQAAAGRGSSTSSGAVANTPATDLTGADERVKNAKAQLDTAKKQLTAAKALVKAAQAEYTAAQADRQALALRTTAQGLADKSGLKSAEANKGDATSPAAAAAPMSGSASDIPSTPAPAGSDFGSADFGNTTPTPAAAPAATLR